MTFKEWEKNISTFLGSDTIFSDRKLISATYDKSYIPENATLVGEWLKVGEGRDLVTYCIFSYMRGGKDIPYLTLFDYEGKILAEIPAVDTGFIARDPKFHVSRLYREGRWLYFENGIKGTDGSFGMVRQDKRDVLGLLSPRYDSYFVKSK